MVYIGHFLLLLFCTSINMIHGIDFEELTRLQENYSNVGPLTSTLTPTNFPQKPATRSLIKTEPDDECSNTLSNALSNHPSSSSSSTLQQPLPRALPRALTRALPRALTQALPVDLRRALERNRIKRRALARNRIKQQSILPNLALMIKNSTVQPYSKQRSSKKRKINQINFTITCNDCSNKLLFKTSLKYNLIRQFEKHIKNKHPDRTKEQTKNYIKEHLRQPELLVKFSINCPESECKHVAHSVRNHDLKIALFRHISKKHPKNYSRESVATYVKDNSKQIFATYTKKSYLD